MTSTLEELKAAVAAAYLAYQEAERAYMEAMIEAAPFKVGDIVNQGPGTGAYRICRVEPKGFAIWYMGNPQRKDGTFGTAERRLFHGVQAVDA